MKAIVKAQKTDMATKTATETPDLAASHLARNLASLRHARGLTQARV